MTAFIIEHQCPQCGAPAELEETDHLFRCSFCRAGSYLSVADLFRYTLPHKAPAGQELFYFPYWRFKGMLFSCLPAEIKNRFVDVSQQAIACRHLPFSLGLRSQTQKLRFATNDTQGVFLKPELSKADLLAALAERFNENLPKPILHQAQIGETISLLYAPFYFQPGLMDAILNKPVGNATNEELAPLMQRGQEPHWPLAFIPTLCPQCGWDLTGEKEALALTCANCRSVWWPKNGKFEPLEVAHGPAPSDDTIYLPFWRIQADIDGIALNSYADLIRVANLPKVPQPGWDERPFYFWCPAFKVRPQNFLTFGAHVTTCQPYQEWLPGPPQARMHGVHLPLQEAVESLALILAVFVKPRQRLQEILRQLHIHMRGFLLVYLPFQQGPHEWVHAGMNLAISKNLLTHAKNL